MQTCYECKAKPSSLICHVVARHMAFTDYIEKYRGLDPKLEELNFYKPLIPINLANYVPGKRERSLEIMIKIYKAWMAGASISDIRREFGVSGHLLAYWEGQDLFPHRVLHPGRPWGYYTIDGKRCQEIT